MRKIVILNKNTGFRRIPELPRSEATRTDLRISVGICISACVHGAPAPIQEAAGCSRTSLPDNLPRGH